MNHICFIVNKYPNKYEPLMLIFVKQLAWAMADLGKKVSVICPLPVNLNAHYWKFKYRTVETTDKGNAIDVYRPKTVGFGQAHYILGKSPVRLTAFFMEKVAKRVIDQMENKPDVVYGHFLAPSGVTVAKVRRKYGLPAFFAYGEAHDTIGEFGAQNAKRELRDVSGVIAVSSFLSDQLIKADVVDREIIKVFPNGVNSDHFHKLDKDTSRAYFGFPKDDVLVAFVGAFNDRKGILRVCEAIEKVNGVKLVCAGKGNQQPFGERCIFAAPVKPEDIPIFNNSADIFLLPTLLEGCSNAVVEAMACGLPVISSDLPFNDDVLDDDCAIRVDPTDVDAIAAAIKRLAYDSILREKMSNAALEKAKSLTLEQRAKNIIDFIDMRCGEYEREHKNRN